MLSIKAFRKQQNRAGWLMSIPALISVCIFIVYPIMFSFVLSFTGIRSNLDSAKWNNFENYAWLFSENGKVFWQSLWVSLKFSFISTLLQTLLGFFLAYLLYNMGRRMKSVYRVLLYIPCILPSAVVAVMWKFIYAWDVGLLYKLFDMFGWSQIHWMTDAHAVIAGVIIANTWRFVGITMVLYFVNMNAVSKDVLESAVIEGANKWTILWRFIFPLTFSSTKMNLILSFVGGMKTFDLFFLMTGGGIDNARPVGQVIFSHAFQMNRMGWAIVMSFMLSVLLGTITVITNKLMDKTEDVYGA